MNYKQSLSENAVLMMAKQMQDLPGIREFEKLEYRYTLYFFDQMRGCFLTELEISPPTKNIEEKSNDHVSKEKQSNFNLTPLTSFFRSGQHPQLRGKTPDQH